MALFINTNVASLGAQRSLATSGAELKTAMERLSSGKKINSAADDAAGFAIAERMTAQIRGLNMATKNANDGLSMLGVIENATNDVTDMLHRMRELAIQATNDTNSDEDRAFLQLEVAQLITEIDRVADRYPIQRSRQYLMALLLQSQFRWAQSPARRSLLASMVIGTDKSGTQQYAGDCTDYRRRDVSRRADVVILTSATPLAPKRVFR